MHANRSLLLLSLQLASSHAADPREFKAIGKPFPLPNSGCEAVPIGCFSDCLAEAEGQSIRTLPISPGGCCGEDPGGCTTCPTACIVASAKTADFEKKICPRKEKKQFCPTCTPEKLTGAICADFCAQMNPEYKYSGVEYSTQCFCGIEVHGKAQKDQTTAGAAVTCDMPCKGNPSEMCGGNCAITMYEIQCGNNWGLPIILILLIGGVVYVSGGIAYNHKTKGTPLGKEALPNQDFWANMSALVVDGAIFSAAKTKVGVAMAVAKAKGEPYDASAAAENKESLLAADPETAGGAESPTKKKGFVPKGPRAVAEQRDESVHPSKAKITVVLSPKKDGAGSSSDDDLVE